MAAVDILVTNNRSKTANHPMNTTFYRGKGDLSVPEGRTGVKPNEMTGKLITDHFRHEKSYSKGNLGLSSATSYQSIHAAHPRSIYSVLMYSLPRQSLHNRPSSTKSKLPTLFQRSSSRKVNRTSWRTGSVPPAKTQNHSISSSNHNENEGRSHSSASKLSGLSPSSLAWTAAHSQISATGQALLSESYKNRSFYNNTSGSNQPSNASMVAGTHLPHHTLVNYVPFYEPRGRGDGASVVEFPINEKKSKHRSPSPDNIAAIREAAAALTRNVADHRAPSVNLKTPRTDSPDWPGATERPKATTRTEGVGGTVKHEKKRVRFSSTVCTDRMEEPAYVETLLHSVNAKLNKRIKEGWSTGHDTNDSKTEKKTTRKPTPNEMASTIDEDEEDSTNFVSPITRVTVTRRKASSGLVTTEESVEDKDTKPDTSKTNIKPQPKSIIAKHKPQQRILDMATRILNNSSNLAPVAENPSHENSHSANADVNAKNGYPNRGSRKEHIMSISKYVQKKQTVISPAFPNQVGAQRKTFMSYASKLSKSDVTKRPVKISTNSATTSRSVSKNGWGIDVGKRTPASPQVTKPTVQYISIDLNINNLAHSPRPSTSAALPLAGETPRSTSFLSGQATHFQPIPSMPEHINFCDPRKTEHILEWLDDVNRKRNIDIKLNRVSSSMSARTIS